jgi:hypothetical protein
MSWEDQGRQEHGWFGNGTAPKKFAVAAGAREIFGRNELAQRIRAVAYGALGALPRALRARLAAQYDAGSLARFTEVMTAWNRGTKLGDGEFADRFFRRTKDDPIAEKLHSAALDVGLATSHAELRQAAEKVASAIQAVGLDRWPRFLADAQDRARKPSTVAALERSKQPPDPSRDAIRPVYPVETMLGIAATGIAGGSMATVRAMGVAILKQMLPNRPSLPATTGEILMPGGQPVGIVEPGARQSIRTVSPPDFQELESKLLDGAKPGNKPNYPGSWYQRPDGSSFGIRESPGSGRTIDVDDASLPRGLKVHQK